MFGPEIKPEEITYDKRHDKLGTGSYGTVYKGRCRGLDVAVKIPNKQELSPEEVARFKEEVKILSKNSHPNIIRLMGACTENGRLQIVTERCATDLEKLLAGREFQFAKVMRIARDIAKGMVWLHEGNPPTIHRDLKPANILIDFHNQVKISDFGLSQVRTDISIRDKPRGSLWMAPEVMLSKPFNEKIDVYSFGIILWELATKEVPFRHILNTKHFVDAICFKKERPPLYAHIPVALKNLMTKCWAPNPAERYHFSEIVFRLNEIIADAVIKDPHAALMWKKNFLLPGHQDLHELIEWQKFQLVLQESVGADAGSLSMFQRLMAQTAVLEGVEVLCVGMDRFYQFVQWFGPFYDTAGKSRLEEMKQLVDTDWFHGDISRDTANSRLSGRAPKSFLVRLSSTDPLHFPFSISMLNNTHERLERVEGGLKTVKGEIFSTLHDFVEANRTELAHPCPQDAIHKYTSVTDDLPATAGSTTSTTSSNDSFTPLSQTLPPTLPEVPTITSHTK